MTGLKRISYVEDEPDIRAVTELALTSIGDFDLDICCDGNEAVERIPKYVPDLVLLDVMMPGLTGPEVMHRMRANPDIAGTPVIFMTAKVQNREVEEYMKLGAAGVIPKPYDPMALCEQVQEIWNRRCAAEEERH